MYLADLINYCKRTNNKLHTVHTDKKEFCHTLIQGLIEYFSYSFSALDVCETIKSFKKIYEQSIVLAYWVNDKLLKELADFYPELYLDLSATLKNRDHNIYEFYSKGIKKQFFNDHNIEIAKLQDSILPTLGNPSYLRSIRLKLNDALMQFYQLKKTQLFVPEYLEEITDEDIKDTINTFAFKLV